MTTDISKQNKATDQTASADLVKMLEERRALCQRLLDLGAEQTQVIAGGDPQGLMTLLSQRQALIDGLIQLNGRIEPFKTRGKGIGAKLAPEVRQRAQALLDEAEAIMRQVFERGETDLKAWSQQCGHLNKDIQQIDQGVAVNRAYGQATGSAASNRYTDQEG